MSTMEDVNARYVKTMKRINLLRQYEEKIAAVTGIKGQDNIVNAKAAVALLSTLPQEMNCSDYPMIKDTVSIGNQYMRCFDAINTYKSVWSQKGPVNSSTIFNTLNKLKKEKSKYDELNGNFSAQYDTCVDSVGALHQVVAMAISNTMSEEQHKAERLKNEAREIAASENTTELKKNNPINASESLPDEFLVARTPVQSVSMPVMRDIGIARTYQNIYADLRNQGNVMILSNFENVEDRRIDEFVIAYVLRFIESFPLGTINVHIFDQNTNYLYLFCYSPRDIFIQAAFLDIRHRCCQECIRSPLW